MQLRWRLQILRKNNLSMSDFISRAKDLFNHLSVAGVQISLREQIMYLVNGLNFVYNSLITTITYKQKMPTLEEVFTMTHAHEQQIMTMHSLYANPQLIHANFVQHAPSGFGFIRAHVPNLTPSY